MMSIVFKLFRNISIKEMLLFNTLRLLPLSMLTAMVKVLHRQQQFQRPQVTQRLDWFLRTHM